MGRIQKATVAAAYLLGSGAAFIIPSGKLAPGLEFSTSSINGVQSQRYVDISCNTHPMFDVLPMFFTWNDEPRSVDPRLEAVLNFDDLSNPTNPYRYKGYMTVPAVYC